MAPKNKKSEFKKLQKEWYDKLKQSGFDDIEKNDPNGDYYLSPLPSILKDKNYVGGRPRWKIQEEYYSMARHFATNYIFPTELEATIWTYHSEGIGCRNISKLLKEVNINVCKSKINMLIQHYATIMRKIKWLELSQNNSSESEIQ